MSAIDQKNASASALSGLERLHPVLLDDATRICELALEMTDDGRPLRVVLATVGSRGDVQPMLVLAAELRGRGHQVRFAAPPNFGAMIAEAGFDFVPIGTDTARFLEEHSAVVEQNPIVALPRIVALIRAEAERQIVDLLGISGPTDVVVGAGLSFGASTLADRDGAAYVYISFTLWGLRSAAYPPAPVPVFGLPRWGNRALWAGITRLFDGALAGTLGRERRAHGLGPVAPWHSIHGSRTLLAQDEVLGALPADVVGCVGRVPALASLAPLEPLSTELNQFLGDDAERGRARRVYLGFGSMPAVDRGRLFSMAVELARLTGARVVLYSAYGGRHTERLADGVLRIAESDHRALFPRMDLVVHHGGAGTTAAALRAGVPQLLVPHIQDQFAHGRRIAELGLGPKPLPKAKLTVEALVEALASSEAQRARAREVGEALAGQGGARAAVDLLERSAAERPARPSAA
jgi:vancomycin aglycone glucosyltransferase